MNCTHAQLLLQFPRRELSTDDGTTLDEHLAGCPACSALAAEFSAFDAMMGSAMKAVPVPTGLVERLTLSAMKQRRAYERRLALRGLALVAAVVAACVTGFYLARPSLNTALIADEQDRLYRQPAETAAEWLTRNRLEQTMPEELDLQLATFVGRRELQGVSTLAMRLDTANRQSAWVYFVHSNTFNTRSAEEGQMTSHTTVKLVPARPSGWTAVVVYTGNDWKAFLRPPVTPG